MTDIAIKHIYDQPSATDGYRVLIDRLWPRGVSKERAALDLWLKDIAPLPELRSWFGHKPERLVEFTARYEAELEKNPTVEKLINISKNQHKVTLLYAAHDPTINHAQVLLTYLKRR